MVANIGRALFRGGVPRTLLPIDAIKYIPNEAGSEEYVLAKNRDPDVKTCKLGLPIPPQPLRLGYGSTDEEYLLLAEDHVGQMLDILAETDFSIQPGNRVLEFGCASGRMIRMLKKYAETCEIWGSDIDAKLIHWDQLNLSPPFHFAVTTTIPHLPFEDGYFNLVYAGSVFTHVEDLTRAWLLELRRVLAPGGRLYVTIHDRQTMKLLEPDYIEKHLPQVLEKTGQNREGQRRLSNMLVRNEFYQKTKNTPFEMLVLGRDTVSMVFFDSTFFRKLASPMFETLLVRPEAYTYQTAIVLGRVP